MVFPWISGDVLHYLIMESTTLSEQDMPGTFVALGSESDGHEAGVHAGGETTVDGGEMGGKNIDYMCGLIWWLSIWEKNIYIYMCVYVYVCIYIYMCVYVYVCIYLYMWMGIYLFYGWNMMGINMVWYGSIEFDRDDHGIILGYTMDIPWYNVW